MAAGAAALVAMVVLASVPPAAGAHWPQFGGDGGRSGYQPVDEGGPPAEFLYARTGLADRDVRTSILTTSGDPPTQRLVYGTADGRIHLRTLLAGTEVGPAGGVDVSDAPNPFGAGSASASFVDTSTPTSLGQVFAVHNDVDGVSIAQIDEASGTLVRDVPIPGALGFRIESAALATGPGPAGERSLFFVASRGPEERLFRVAVTNAASREAGIAASEASSTEDVNATTTASPTLVHLNDAAGRPTAYVAVGTFDGRLLTFAASDLSRGPSATGLGGAAVRTPLVPVTRSGMTPGAAGSGVATAPFIYAASATATTSRVHRFTQTGNSAVLVVASSAALAGEAAPAMATNQVVEAGGAEAGNIYLTTARNLYAVRTSDLSVSARLHPTDALIGGSNGFSFTTPAVTGDVVAVANDDGRQFLLDATTLAPVAPNQFTQHRSNDDSISSFGQPSISRRFVQFASDLGVFVYRLRRATPPTGYWLVASDGGIFTFGDAGFFGSTGDIVLNSPIVGMATTPTGQGYWLVAADGGMFTFGDAGFFGSTGDIVLNSPIVAMAATPTGGGYWLVASDGGIFTFGDATFFGSTGNLTLNQPIVAMAATPTGGGYWLVASDGGMFTFGDAGFFGSTGDIRLNRPIVGMAATSSGTGYWLVASDGGIFTFGDARFLGSTGDIRLNRPIVAMGASVTDEGYTMAATDGGIFTFGDARFFGSTGDIALNRPIVGLALK